MKSQVWSDMKSGQFLDFKSFYGNDLSNHNFVLSNQDGVLVEDMSFEVKKYLCSPDDDIHYNVVFWTQLTCTFVSFNRIKVMQIYKLEIKSVIPECELKIQALTMQD